MSSTLLKRGQLHILMIIIVLVVFMAFAFLGIALYGSTQVDTAQREAVEATSIRAIELTEVVMNLPELRCSINSSSERNCIDMSWLNTLDGDHYRDMFGFAVVRVEGHQVSFEGNQVYTLYNNPTGGNREATRTPVTLYNPVTHSRYQGAVVTEVYT